MRARWTLLFYMALATLVGVAWLAQRLHQSLASWVNLELVGAIAASGIAFWAMVKPARERWPAALVLLCAAPLGQELLSAVVDFPSIVVYLGLPGVLIIGGAFATIAVATFILIAKPPPAPDEPIPSARQRG